MRPSEPPHAKDAKDAKEDPHFSVPCISVSKSPPESSRRIGLQRLAQVQQYHDLLSSGLSSSDAAFRLQLPRSTIYRLHRTWLQSGRTLESLIPQTHLSGRKPEHPLTANEIAAIKSRKLQINRTATTSSTPQAIRDAIRAGELRPDISASLQTRLGSGLSLPDSLLHSTHLSEAAIRAYRSPREAWLDYVQAPGSLMLTRDPITNIERPWQVGEAWTMDDGTINMGCTVDMERPGDPCWEHSKCILGRFQFLVIPDHRCRMILGYSYTARPRDSYRAEDLVATLQTTIEHHGCPRVLFLEHGVSASNLLRDTLGLLGIEPRYCASPHQKVIEYLFNLLWTKLSQIPGQVGRFRGEMERESSLYEACKRGHKDPRRHFPPLATVLQALRESIAQLNSELVTSPQYGSWVPSEWWLRNLAARSAHPSPSDKSAKSDPSDPSDPSPVSGQWSVVSGQHWPRPLPPNSAWMFSPCVRGPLIVRRFAIATSFPLMPGLSIQLHYAANFLADIIGAQVKLHFNPFAPETPATVVLAAPFQGRPAGTVLGAAEQINRHARYTRRAFGYGDDPDIGAKAAKQHAQALRRVVQSIRPDGKPGLTAVETRAYSDVRDQKPEISRRNLSAFNPDDLLEIPRSLSPSDTSDIRSNPIPHHHFPTPSDPSDNSEIDLDQLL